HEPSPVVTRIGFNFVYRRACGYPSLDSSLHSLRGSRRCKREIGGACNMESTIREIVEHVALVRMRLAPGVFMWSNVGGFAKVAGTGVLCCVQVTHVNEDPVRDAIVTVASVIVGIRGKNSGERIDPRARTYAVLVAIQASDIRVRASRAEMRACLAAAS